MKYMLMFHETAEEVAKADDPAQAGPYWAAWGAYMAAMGPLIESGAPLAGIDQATTLRIANGKRVVEDGPFATTKERFGGYVILDMPDLDAALDWAAKAPCAAAGSVEVRPLGQGPGEQG